MSENLKLMLQEDYQIFDMLAKGMNTSKKSGPLGWVKILFDHKKHFEGPNLVVGQGREFTAQKIFNTDVILQDTVIGHSENDAMYDYKISHFAIGSGGATIIDNNEFSLEGPIVTDTCLLRPITLGISSYLTEPHLMTGTTDPYTETDNDLHKSIYAVKPIDSVYLEKGIQYPQSNLLDWYTKVKCTCIIPENEPADLGIHQSVQVSEAGLYFTNYQREGGANIAKMFSRVTFPPKWKELESIMTIIWYILC